MENKSHLTAIKRNRLSKPWALALAYLPNECPRAQVMVLDYGCGRGDDRERLTQMGYDAYGYDPHYTVNEHSIHDRIYDIVSLVYVLNVIQNPQERLETLQKGWSLVRPGGHLLVAVRHAKEVVSASGKKEPPWERLDESGWCYRTSRGTYQKFFNNHEIEYLMDNATDHLGEGHFSRLKPGIYIIKKED